MKISEFFGPLGVLLGWGLAILTRYFEQVWFGANLDITCSIEGNKAEQPDGVYIKFRVQNNNKRRVAKSCRAYLVELYKITDGRPVSENLISDTFQLPWAGHDFETRDIPAKVSQYVDLVCFSKHTESWNFLTKPTFYLSLSKLKEYRGTYRFTVLVAGDGAVPQEKYIFVNYNGNWKSVSIYD